MSLNVHVVTLPDWIVMPLIVFPDFVPVGVSSSSTHEAVSSSQSVGTVSVTDSVSDPTVTPIGFV